MPCAYAALSVCKSDALGEALVETLCKIETNTAVPIAAPTWRRRIL